MNIGPPGEDVLFSRFAIKLAAASANKKLIGDDIEGVAISNAISITFLPLFVIIYVERDVFGHFLDTTPTSIRFRSQYCLFFVSP